MCVAGLESIKCSKLIILENLAVNSFLSHCSPCDVWTHTVLLGREFQDCEPATDSASYLQVRMVCASECNLQVVLVSLYLLPLCFQV